MLYCGGGSWAGGRPRRAVPPTLPTAPLGRRQLPPSCAPLPFVRTAARRTLLLALYQAPCPPARAHVWASRQHYKCLHTLAFPHNMARIGAASHCVIHPGSFRLYSDCGAGRGPRGARRLCTPQGRGPGLGRRTPARWPVPLALCAWRVAVHARTMRPRAGSGSGCGVAHACRPPPPLRPGIAAGAATSVTHDVRFAHNHIAYSCMQHEPLRMSHLHSHVDATAKPAAKLPAPCPLLRSHRSAGFLDVKRPGARL
jgi:hypothetical protein